MDNQSVSFETMVNSSVVPSLNVTPQNDVFDCDTDDGDVFPANHHDASNDCLLETDITGNHVTDRVSDDNEMETIRNEKSPGKKNGSKTREVVATRKSPRQMALKASREVSTPNKVFIQSAKSNSVDLTEISEEVFVLRNGKFVPLFSAPDVTSKLTEVPISKRKNSLPKQRRAKIASDAKISPKTINSCSQKKLIVEAITSDNDVADEISHEDGALNGGAEMSELPTDDFLSSIVEVKKEDCKEDLLCMWDENQEKRDDAEVKFDIKGYVCKMCGQQFSFLSALVMHKKEDHGDYKPYECRHCPQQFKVRYLLKRHLLKCHGNMGLNVDEELTVCNPLLNVYACGDCGKVFSTSDLLMTHKKERHSGGLDFGHRCFECGMTFSLPDSLQRHLKTHGCDVPFACSVCSMGFKTSEERARHQRCHVTGYRQMCHLCDRAFLTIDEATRHMDDAHKSGDRYVCEVSGCGQAFAQPEEIQKHFFKAHRSSSKPRVNRHICDKCGKTFGNRSYFNNHMLLHNGERPHVCKECGRAFTHRNVLYLHETTHRRREIACEICGHLFPNNHQLRSHQRKHNEARPFQCKICGMQFKWRTAMTNHAKRTHSTERPFKCDDCGRLFPLLGSLNTHRKIHSGVKPHVCEHCGKAFVRKKHLRVHIRIHTGEKPYHCYLCSRRFTQLTGLRCHAKTHGAAYDYEIHKGLFSTSVWKQRESMRRIMEGDDDVGGVPPPPALPAHPPQLPPPIPQDVAAFAEPLQNIIVDSYNQNMNIVYQPWP